ncbi:sugar diacid recognition domain-containing protein [Virgibacillus proomii]|uniref:sugar diacid recognition domain-containing protein n=1 Tax=Virgibacillus proomii TaxID=84407 RepID=UPI001C11428E|nr:sugar diacid recognition domain-containing protein [Virgibacillus proomii]MBU5267807.1 hypothetical protein [Virgibacillus proomii]
MGVLRHLTCGINNKPCPESGAIRNANNTGKITNPDKKAISVSKEITEIPSLTDVNGKIIGDSNYRRVGAFHRASKDVILKNDFVIYEEKDILNEKNVLPEVAVPLVFNN